MSAVLIPPTTITRGKAGFDAIRGFWFAFRSESSARASQRDILRGLLSYLLSPEIMSRFENLEFESGEELTPRQSTGARGETRLLAEAGSLFEAGRFEQALRAYAKVLEFNPRQAAAWTGQVRMLIELGEFDEARVWADKALAYFPDEPELLAAKAVALARRGDLAGALSYSDAAVESRGNTPYIWLARGDVLLARAEKRAEFCFEKALSLAGESWVVLWLASRIQTYYKHFAKGLKLAQQALALEAGRAVLWMQTGQCQLALGLAAQARLSFEQARELDPECDAAQWRAKTEEANILDKVTGRWRQWFGK
jgi:tetratricopeptide (TPR) repeat protein